MKHTTITLTIASCLSTVLVAVTLFVLNQSDNTLARTNAPVVSQQMHRGPEVEEQVEDVMVDDDESTVSQEARRLDDRLRRAGKGSPGPVELAHALRKRDQLLDRVINVNLYDASTQHTATGSIAVVDHPSWVLLTINEWSATYHIDQDAIAQALDRGDVGQIRLMKPAVVQSTMVDNKKVLRATTSAVAKAGYVIDAEQAAEQIASALEKGIDTVTLTATYGKPTATITKPDGTTKTLTLLGTGMSDFADSTEGREWNVHKAIDERVNNVVVPAGETFSLIAALDAPITLEKGWKEALGLFGGGAAMTPGGGICQSATTLYRAFLLAGLPIVQKRNHSLFVDHYEFYGVGLDATVFPGFHDVRFRNDTGEDLLIQAYTEGITVYVNIFGQDDGRRVAMDGPYFAGTQGRPSTVRPLGYNQIAWVRTITRADGSTIDEPLYATYAKPLFGYLKKYTKAGMKLLTTREL